MLDASTVTATVACEKSPFGAWTVPDQRANDPRTFAITRCRTENCRLEWLLSISQRSVLMAPPHLLVHSVDAWRDGKWSSTRVDLYFQLVSRPGATWCDRKDYRNDSVDSQFEMVSEA